MATTLQQIMGELDSYYKPSTDLYNSQLQAIPKQQEADIAGLDAKLNRAYGQIVDGARSRGLGFSGIPMAEQAEYNASEYMPAVAKVKQQGESNRLGILESMNALGREQRGQAQSMFDTYENRRLQEEQAAEQRRQFEANLAFQREQAKAAAGSGSLGGGAYLGGGGASSSASKSAGGSAQMVRTTNGFNFADSSGKGVSALAYSSMKGVGFRELLSEMAKSGDTNAKFALQVVGNDGYANPNILKSLPGAVRSGLKALGVRNA